MPVHHENVRPAVVIKIKKCRAPAHVGNCRRRHARLERNVGEARSSIIAKQVFVFLGEVRDENGKAAVMQIIAESDSHGALLGAVLTYGGPGQEAHFLEMAFAFIAIVKVRRGIVGHKKVQAAIAVEVRPNGAQAVETVRIVHARFLEARAYQFPCFRASLAYSFQ